MSLIQFLRASITLLVAFPLTFIVSFCAWCDLTFIRKSKEKAHIFPRFWGRTICTLAGVTVEIKGLENIDKNKTYIFAANHCSQFDIFCFQGYFPYNFRWIAKKELFSIPIFGQAMHKVGYIAIDRSHGRKALKSLEQAAKQIAQGASVIIFPEGTRSPDGTLQEFKTGAIMLAIKSGVPVVPMAFKGSYAILPKGKFFPKGGKVSIEVGTPIPTEKYVSRDKQQLAVALHSEVKKLIEN